MPRKSRKPAPKKKAPKVPNAKVKVSRLGYYIIIFGWLTLAVNLLLAFEWASQEVVMERVMSAELSSLTFRAIALIIPLIFSILGYMVYQREKMLWKVISTGKKLEGMNLSLQSNYDKLANKMTDKDNSGLTEQAVEVVKGMQRQTKSNINLIASLMEAQSKKMQDETAADVLREFQRRLRVIEHINDLMCKGADCTAVIISDYLKFIGNDIINSYSDGKIRLTVEAKPWPMGLDRALTCGLITSELVSNCVRFAFTEDMEKPDIKISLLSDSEGNAVLRVSDNGVGMPEDLDIELLDTLGMKIIRKLANQLKGTMEIHTMGGTSIDVRFPIK
jgi:two-component sensor histidine kinase